MTVFLPFHLSNCIPPITYRDGKARWWGAGATLKGITPQKYASSTCCKYTYLFPFPSDLFLHHCILKTRADMLSPRQSRPRSFGTQPGSLTAALASFRQHDNNMPDVTGIANSRAEAVLSDDNLPPEVSRSSTQGSCTSSTNGRSPLLDPKTPELSSPIPSPNLLSRNVSTSDFSSYQEEWETPLETLTVFDLLDNLALPSRLEKWQTKLSAQTERVRRQREKIKSSTSNAKDRVVEEWRRRLPPPDEQLDKYRKRMSDSVNRLGSRWHDTKAVTAREKLSFIAGVLNIFISGYLIGGHPDLFYVWFTAQLCYFMPIRFYTYHKRGYHYFLADMCYFVNFLLLLTIWVAPKSKRLFIGTYCLAYGNNAVAIAMWRNSMVFHSLDKVTRSVGMLKVRLSLLNSTACSSISCHQ